MFYYEKLCYNGYACQFWCLYDNFKDSSDICSYLPHYKEKSDEHENESKTRIIRRGCKRRWNVEENTLLRKRFKRYIGSEKVSVSESELRDIAKLLPHRTSAQIRTKLNNMRLGKSA